jgi:BirA family biotin operon repressor/biotin-[acetyl-CoA-carboxylase] ligase
MPAPRVTSAEQIVAWLRTAAGPLSGEELARRLGCSRAAVWKHVAALRRRGYAITGRHAVGYTLAATPDRLGPAELAPHLAGTWRRIEWRAETDSTQRVARDLARAGAAEGTTVVAEAQTAGRGRLGRTWHSPPGVNVYVSVVLRPPVAPALVPQLALVAGLAVADAVAATGLEPAIKWPNDVLVGGRKVAGVLTEMEAEVERVGHAVVGIGVNVNGTAFPPDLREKATSLRIAAGRPVDRAAFTGRLLAALESRYATWLAGGFAALRDGWERRASLTGRAVRIAAPDGEVAGRVRGIGADGALEVVRADGALARIVAGEVTVADGYRAG